MQKNIRQPAVAGQFYSDNPSELEGMIKGFLISVPEKKVDDNVKAIMVPHAGYVFSGSVAAYSYKQLKGKSFDNIFIICNSHSAYFEGIAVDNNDVWETPLGEVEVNKELAEKLVKADSSIKFNSEVHLGDHSLEVQVPFLQTVLEGKFKIVPILFGNSYDDGYEKLASALADNLGENDLVAISTDMSHYPSYEDANRIDKETLGKIQAGDIPELENHIKKVNGENIPREETLLCGVDGVKTVMSLANVLGWDTEILKYANSGDVPIGDPTSPSLPAGEAGLRGTSKNGVVGYGAVAFFSGSTANKAVKPLEEVGILNKAQQSVLLNIAKSTVESYVRDGKTPEFEIDDMRLNWKEGAFVTLKNSGKLRGCIGQIVPTEKPLWQVVRDQAISAATEDNRFEPVSEKDLDKLDYEVSVLSKPEKINNWQDIELEKHGVIIRKGMNRGVFLPQVAEETGWTREEFLSQLCFQKAGLNPDCYKDSDTEIQVFTAQVF